MTYQEQQSGEQTSKSTDKLVGTLLDGRFQIEEVLGSGGMSVVYKATQLRVNRHVAIKTLRLQLDSKPVYRERFQREISLLCTLNHPHIVTVYDCVIGEDDQPYVVMDYLRGESLEAMIARHGVIPIDRFARIAVQVCGALDHAHRKGVVHRDLKPGNIVLMDEDVDLVKVVDFGLAKLNQDNRRLTNSGELWASPPYMSPEQCTGKSEDERSDIYSFGCVMYEMLCGKDPFHYAQTVFELISTHVGVPPKSMAETNPAVAIPPKIEAMVMKCLEKEPADRFQNAIELRDALAEACAGTPNTGDLLLYSNHVKAAQPTKAETPPEPSMTTSKYFNMAMDPLQGMNPEEVFAQSAPAANPAQPTGAITSGAGGLAGGVQQSAAAPTFAANNRAGVADVPKPAVNVQSIRGFEAPPPRSSFGSLIIAAVIGAAVVIGGAFAIPTMIGHKPAGSVTPNAVPENTSAPSSSSAPAVSTASPPQPGSTGTQSDSTPAPGHQVTPPSNLHHSAPATEHVAPPPVHKKPPVVKPRVAAPLRHATPPPVKPKHAKPPAVDSGGSPWDVLQKRRTKEPGSAG